MDHVAGLWELTVAIRPGTEEVAVEVVGVDVCTLQFHLDETVNGERSGGCHEIDEMRHQGVLLFDFDIEQHEFGVAEVLDQPDGVAPGGGVVGYLDEGPAMDPDLQVERLHRFFMGVTITFEAHGGSMAKGCHTRRRVPAARDRS